MTEKIDINWQDKALFADLRAYPAILKPVPAQSCGRKDAKNLIIEGDNLAVMASLLTGSYNLRGGVDMLIWDPPYNTGSGGFLYNDRRYLSSREVKEKKRDNKDLKSDWVSAKDPSRHSKWLNFMAARLVYGKKMLKRTGIAAVFIDDAEVFRMGMLMDEIFGEENRVACAPWLADPGGGEKKKALRSGHEYILIYHNGDNALITREERDIKTAKLSDKQGTYYKGDKLLKWGDNSYRADRLTMYFAVKAPDGTLVYPMRHDGEEGRWRWGSPGKMDNVIADPNFAHWEKVPYKDGVKVNSKGDRWVPFEKIRGAQRSVGWSSWLDQHGSNAAGTRMLNRILGPGAFKTVKPVEIYEWLVRLHGNESGTILDAFGGSGTLGHAVLKVNSEDQTDRRFIMIESGSTKEHGGISCNKLTAERIRRVISGGWEEGKNNPLPGEFVYLKAGSGDISRKSILASQREDLADIILQSSAGSSGLLDCRVVGGKRIIGRTRDGHPIALVWDSGEKGKELTPEILDDIIAEVDILNTRDPALGLSLPVAIFATVNGGPNGSSTYSFHQIPSAILAALGLPQTGDGV